LVRSDLEDPGRGQHRRRVHVVVGRPDRPGTPGEAPTGERTDLHLRLGIDGFFTDFPATGVKVRDQVRGVK
jgi:hypothetical protein